MLVQCPECGTKYNLNEDQIAPRGSKVRCSRCTAVFTAFRPDSQGPVAAPAPQKPVPDQAATDAGQAPPDQVQTGPKAGADQTSFADEWDSWTNETPSSSAKPSSSSFEDELDAIFSGKKETPSTPVSPPAPAPSSSFADDLEQLFEKKNEGPKPATRAERPAPDAFDDDLDDAPGQREQPKVAPGPVRDDLAADLEGAFQQPLLETSASETRQAQAKTVEKSGRFGLLVAILLLLIILLGAGLYFKFIGLPVGAPGPESVNATAETGEAVVSAAQISLENVRQYFVPNEKEGQLFIIEGKAVNRFAEPKNMLRLKASLFDKQGETVTTQEFTCGNVVTLYQLQVSSRQDIEAALGAKVGILTSNTNIQPGAAVPFMTVFFNTPETVEEFGLEVIHSQSPQ